MTEWSLDTSTYPEGCYAHNDRLNVLLRSSGGDSLAVVLSGDRIPVVLSYRLARLRSARPASGRPPTLPSPGEVVGLLRAAGVYAYGRATTRGTREEIAEEVAVAERLKSSGIPTKEVIDRLMAMGLSRATAYRRLKAAS